MEGLSLIQTKYIQFDRFNRRKVRELLYKNMVFDGGGMFQKFQQKKMYEMTVSRSRKANVQR